MAVDVRACRLLRDIVAALQPGYHVFVRDHARVEVNRRESFATVWLLLPPNRAVLTAFGRPGTREWRCTDDDAVAFALYTLEEELGSGDEVLYVEVLGDA